MRKVRAAGADGLLVSREEDVSYLTGFSGDSSWLVVSPRWTCLITDGRYDEQARRQCPDVDVHVRNVSPAAALATVLKGRGIRRLGTQGGALTVDQQAALTAELGARRIKRLDELVAGLRVCKDDDEIAAVRKAVRMAQRALKGLMSAGARGFVGRTERDLAGELEYRMRQAGADAASFETIVAAGAHGSLPHYLPGATRIRRGQAVLIDFGARAGGYCSDLTRVVFVGRIPREVEAFYDVVRRARAAGIAAVGPGRRCCDVDAAARAVIETAGYGDKFVHGLGHGIGRQVHEGPALARTNRQRLRPGMIVTVEPGIYLPGVGGVRIEDDVLVTGDGRRTLSSLPTRAQAMLLR